MPVAEEQWTPPRTSFLGGQSFGRRHMSLLAAAARAGVMAQELKADVTTGLAVARYSQDVAPILKLNREEQIHGAHRYGPIGHHVARIPNIVYMQWLVEEGIDAYRSEDWPKVRAKLNSPEYAYLRVDPRRL